jgi:putative SOS response-associated peptidase YedK
MCGRFTLRTSARAVAETFDLLELPADFTPRYNVTPTQPVAVVWFDRARGAESSSGRVGGSCLPGPTSRRSAAA